MLSTPRGYRGMVTAPHHLAAQAGRDVLAEGGNAIEAMIAMAAAIPVVYPHMNAIGGDGFWLVREPKGRVRAFEACGPAGAKATVARYQRREYETIPPRGPDAALTVPGAVGGWALALDYARTIGGRLTLRDLLSDAIRHAREGVPVSPSQARCQPDLGPLAQAPGFASVYLREGKIPPVGTLLRYEALAATLDELEATDAPLLGHMVFVATQLAKQLGFAESGYRLVMNCGSLGGQSVFHIHLHLLGGRSMQWPPG